MKLVRFLAGEVFIGLFLYCGLLMNHKDGTTFYENVGTIEEIAGSESIQKIWHGEYDWRLLGQGQSFWGGTLWAKTLILILTDRIRLIVKHQSGNDDSFLWAKGDLPSVRLLTSDEGELLGADGQLEIADVVEVETGDGRVLRLRVPRSAVKVLREFSS